MPCGVSPTTIGSPTFKFSSGLLQLVVQLHRHTLLKMASQSAPGYTQRAPPAIIIPAFYGHHSLDPKYGKSLAVIEDSVKSSEFEEYGAEIYIYMKELEVRTLPSPKYMEGVQSQGMIDWKMRKTLVVWLVEVHKEYNLRQETLFLAINILDRYCSHEIVERAKYQLLGITCLWIAAKYEENHGRVPNVKNLSFMCCDSYTERQFLVQENHILRIIRFELGFITPETFLKRLVKMNPSVFANAETRAMSRFIMEIALPCRYHVYHRASIIAQASLLLAYQISNNHSGWKVDEEIEYCRQNMYESIFDAPAPIVLKYAGPELCYASIRAQNWCREQRRYQPALGTSASSIFASGQLTPPKDATCTFWGDSTIPTPPHTIHAHQQHQLQQLKGTPVVSSSFRSYQY